jgi:hypothetical protein
MNRLILWEHLTKPMKKLTVIVIFISVVSILAWVYSTLFTKEKDRFRVDELKISDVKMKVDTLQDKTVNVFLSYNMTIRKKYVSTRNSPKRLFADSREPGFEGLVSSSYRFPNFYIVTNADSINIDELTLFDKRNLLETCCGVDRLDDSLSYMALTKLFETKNKLVRGKKLDNVKIPFVIKFSSNLNQNQSVVFNGDEIAKW